MKDIDQYSELIARFLAGESSLAEKEELFAWTSANQSNRQFFEELEEVWNLTETADATPFEADLDIAWNKIDEQTSPISQSVNPPTSQPSAKIIPLSKRIMRWSIAAAILLSSGIGLWWLMQPVEGPAFVEISTQDDEKKEVTLPDGSSVWLNENSSLSYLEDFAQRNVELEGEAFFDVERIVERPFKISSGEAVTTVLGTSFNVRAYPKEERVEVTVETGKVALAASKATAKPVELPAGTSGIVYKKEKKAERVEEKIDNAISWKTLIIDFEDDPMEKVISTLERHFGTDISVANEKLYECPYTSTFDQPDLDEILMVIGATIGFEVEKEGSAYTLVGDGCVPNN